MPDPKPLEEPYRSRAVPPGSAQYWSWLFATGEARAALLGSYALRAEWHALLDPRSDVAAARIKLDWWHEEIRRLAGHAPMHPIGRYLCRLPGADQVDFRPLLACIDAAAAHLAGAPLEHAAELAAHSATLHGNPLRIAAAFAGGPEHAPLNRCIDALAEAEYLARALAGYRQEAAVGRISFPVDELLAAGIDNTDLAAADPPPRLRDHLERLRTRAAEQYLAADQDLPPPLRPQARHLLVLASLGPLQLRGQRTRSDADFRLRDLYKAWSTARRAAAGR